MSPTTNSDVVIIALNELKRDISISKNVRERIDKIITYLQQDIGLGKDKALLEIEEIFSRNDIEPYARAQMWSVVSMIESL